MTGVLAIAFASSLVFYSVWLYASQSEDATAPSKVYWQAGTYPFPTKEG